MLQPILLFLYLTYLHYSFFLLLSLGLLLLFDFCQFLELHEVELLLFEILFFLLNLGHGLLYQVPYILIRLRSIHKLLMWWLNIIILYLASLVINNVLVGFCTFRNFIMGNGKIMACIRSDEQACLISMDNSFIHKVYVSWLQRFEIDGRNRWPVPFDLLPALLLILLETKLVINQRVLSTSKLMLTAVSFANYQSLLKSILAIIIVDLVLLRESFASNKCLSSLLVLVRVTLLATTRYLILMRSITLGS